MSPWFGGIVAGDLSVHQETEEEHVAGISEVDPTIAVGIAADEGALCGLNNHDYVIGADVIRRITDDERDGVHAGCKFHHTVAIPRVFPTFQKVGLQKTVCLR